jgi:hypothetical protein
MELAFKRVVKFLELRFHGTHWTSVVIYVPGSQCPCRTIYTPHSNNEPVEITRFDGKTQEFNLALESPVQVCEDIISFNSDKPF